MDCLTTSGRDDETRKERSIRFGAVSFTGWPSSAEARWNFDGRAKEAQYGLSCTKIRVLHVSSKQVQRGACVPARSGSFAPSATKMMSDVFVFHFFSTPLSATTINSVHPHLQTFAMKLLPLLLLSVCCSVGDGFQFMKNWKMPVIDPYEEAVKERFGDKSTLQKRSVSLSLLCVALNLTLFVLLTMSVLCRTGHCYGSVFGSRPQDVYGPPALGRVSRHRGCSRVSSHFHRLPSCL